ncbi:Aspartic peptidase [Trema orientale]|uniref:Aspartic peptidase n=1 Tax=Trema orientale TaxID=63057 RepID=A0A2P5FI01_TREOI|nr:Aspartic peptidase [Trema orientale]
MWTTDGISVGSTFGNFITETMEGLVPEFLIGCSNNSTQLPLGHAAFGDGKPSLPSQLGLKKFSFCLLSHYYDDSSTHSDVVFDDETSYDDLNYTSLIKNLSEGPEVRHFSGYHYLNLQGIVVGDTRIEVPEGSQLPGRDGNGGTIIDTGTPFTFLERSIFEAVRQEFETQMGNYTRAPDQGVLGPCFSTVDQDITNLPLLTFIFEGGVKMEFPTQNYFLLDDKFGVVCLSLTTDVISGVGPSVGLSGGPVVIMGNYLLMDFFLEFDSLKSRLGFKREHCDS